VWLDDRAKGKRLRADFSADGAAWGDDVLAYESPDGTICECCAPAIAAADGGAVVAFRNWIDGDRDIWTLRLAAGKTKFGPATKSGTGSWKLAGCPMAGPAVAVRGADVVSAWRRERDVFLAVGMAKERDLGEGTEPQVVVKDDGVHVVWIAGDSLVHLAPGARSSEEIAKSASFPCAADRGGAGRVARRGDAPCAARDPALTRAPRVANIRAMTPADRALQRHVEAIGRAPGSIVVPAGAPKPNIDRHALRPRTLRTTQGRLRRVAGRRRLRRAHRVGRRDGDSATRR